MREKNGLKFFLLLDDSGSLHLPPLLFPWRQELPTLFSVVLIRKVHPQLRCINTTPFTMQVIIQLVILLRAIKCMNKSWESICHGYFKYRPCFRVHNLQKEPVCRVLHSTGVWWRGKNWWTPLTWILSLSLGKSLQAKYYLITADNILQAFKQHKCVYAELSEPEGERNFLMNLLESQPRCWV